MLAFFPLLYYHAACRVLTPIITQQEKEITMNLKNKEEIVKAYGKNEKDTKDFATKRGLLMMVGKRKRLLSYLKSQNLDEYRELIKKLGIRG